MGLRGEALHPALNGRRATSRYKRRTNYLAYVKRGTEHRLFISENGETKFARPLAMHSSEGRLSPPRHAGCSPSAQVPLPTFLLPFLPRGRSDEDRRRPACAQAGCQGLLRRGPLNSGGGVCTALTQPGRGRAPPRGERGSLSPSLPASRLYAEVRTEAAYPDGEGGAVPGLLIRRPCSPGSHVCRAGAAGSVGKRGCHGWSGPSAPPRHPRAAPSLCSPCPIRARPCPPPASARGAPLLFARRSAEGDGVPPGAAQRGSIDPGFPQPLRAARQLPS